MQSTSQPARRTARRRWPWAALAAAVLALYLLDQGLKAGAENGFTPLDAEWRIVAADFPQFWGELEASEPYHALMEHIERPLHGFETGVYERTGIRPTPVRWAVWMGRPLSAAGVTEGWGMCTRPGALLHATHWLRRLMGARPDERGVYAFADIHYGWRGGYLVLSESAAFVALCLDPERTEPAGTPPSGALSIQWTPEGARPLELFVNPAGAMRVTMNLHGPFPHMAEPPQVHTREWPIPVLVSLEAARPVHLAGVLEHAREWLAAAPASARALYISEEVWRQWALPALGQAWREETTGCALALDLSFRASVVPDIELLAAFDGAPGTSAPHPLAVWLDALEPIPFEWEGARGECAALLGDGLALCVAGTGTPWLAASSEPLMAKLAGHPRHAEPLDATVALTVDWRRAAALLRQGLLLAARYESIPGHDMTTIEQDWGDWLDAMAAMGSMRLTGHAAVGQLRLEGPLTAVGAGQ